MLPRRFTQAISQLPIYPPPETVDKISMYGKIFRSAIPCSKPRENVALRMPPPDKAKPNRLDLKAWLGGGPRVVGMLAEALISAMERSSSDPPSSRNMRDFAISSNSSLSTREKGTATPSWIHHFRNSLRLSSMLSRAVRLVSLLFHVTAKVRHAGSVSFESRTRHVRLLNSFSSSRGLSSLVKAEAIRSSGSNLPSFSQYRSHVNVFS